MSENWKSITGFEGLYEVSDAGRIRSVPRVAMRSNGVSMTVRGTILAQQTGNDHGHLKVVLIRNGRWSSHWVHRLVALEWCDRAQGQDHVLHGPAGETVNTADNLRWGTPADNAADRKAFGKPYPPRRTHCTRGHALTPENVYVPPKRPNDRNCKECQRQRVRDYRAAQV